MAVSSEALLRKIRKFAPDAQLKSRERGIKTPSTGRKPNAPILFSPSSAPVGVNSPNAQPRFRTADDFSFDSSYERGVDALKRQLVGAESQYDLANQREEEEYQRAIRTAGQQQGEQSSELLDRMANQGILRSGIQVKASSDLANDFGERRANYERARNESRTDREMDFSNFRRGINDQLGLLKEEKAAKEQERQEAIARRIAQQQPQVNSQGQYSLNVTGIKTDPNTLTGNEYGSFYGGGDGINSSRSRVSPSRPVSSSSALERKIKKVFG